MAELNFSVQADRCNHCGLCVSDCPSRIIEQEGDQLPTVSPENAEKCLECQHCLAICPTGAISVFGLNPDDSLPVSADVWPRLEQMTHLARGRRSVRRYRDKNVEVELIDRLLATAAHAPTGANIRLLTFAVVDDKAKLQSLREEVMAALVKASQAGRIPAKFAYLEYAIAAADEHVSSIVWMICELSISTNGCWTRRPRRSAR